MTVISVPENARGCVGMIARLVRVRGAPDGRLALVRHPVGVMRSLAENDRPAFAWEVVLLGAPAQIGADARREIIVADACLRPVSRVDPSQVEPLIQAQAQRDFDAVLGDLRRILAVNDMAPEAFERALLRAANMAELQRALEEAPTVVVLDEIGFRRLDADTECRRWTGIHDGVELRITAGRDMFDMLWELHAMACAPRHLVWDEARLLNLGLRGEIVLRVLESWRATFGRDAPVPTCLRLGQLYGEHRAMMRKLNPGLPHLALDPDVWRATVRLLRKRYPEPSGDDALRLSFNDAMLTLEAPADRFACPAWGVWADAASISLSELLDIRPHAWRGRVNLEHRGNSVLVKGHPVSVLGAARELDEP